MTEGNTHNIRGQEIHVRLLCNATLACRQYNVPVCDLGSSAIVLWSLCLGPVPSQGHRTTPVTSAGSGLPRHGISAQSGVHVCLGFRAGRGHWITACDNYWGRSFSSKLQSQWSLWWGGELTVLLGERLLHSFSACIGCCVVLIVL